MAKYSSNPPKVVRSYAGWQHTSKGSVDGITGAVDVSHFYTDLAIGKVGSATTAATAQKLLLGGLAVDSIFGPKTWNELLSK